MEQNLWTQQLEGIHDSNMTAIATGSDGITKLNVWYYFLIYFK